MKAFLKTTFAATLGVIIASIITCLLFFIIISGIISASDAPIKVQPNSILKLQLTGVLDEYQTSFMDISSEIFPSDNQQSIGLDEIRQALAAAKKDDNIIGLYIEGGVLSSGIASLEEIRKAVLDFKESGKFVYAYADEVFEQSAYYICTTADSIFMNPVGMFGFYGMSSTPLFYTDVFKKIGIQPEIFKVGSYKSAVEPYTNTEMSAANREQVSSYINNIWVNLLEDISVSRNIPTKQLQQQADKFLLLQPGKEIVAAGLIDGLLYQTEVMELLAKKSGCRPNKLKLVSIKSFNKIPVEEEYIPEKIAIIYAAGEIKTESSGYYSNAAEIIHDDLIKEMQDAQYNKHIKAVVLRVNSPGGSAFASEQICQALQELKKEKPVVVSMGDYAASGGYYISAFADKIIASPTTLTGSIGIFGMFFNAEELSEKVGLHYDVVKTNRYSDFGNMLRGMTTGEKALMQKYVEDGYEQFVDRCATGRNMSREDIKKIAEGRVWTGEQALNIGLVDGLGYIDDAVDLAAEMAGIEQYRIVSYPEKKDFITLWMEKMNQDIQMKTLRNRYGESAIQWMAIKDMTLKTGILARMPYTIQLP